MLRSNQLLLENKMELNCQPYIICYQNQVTSEILSAVTVFAIALLLLLGMQLLSIRLEKRLKTDKKFKREIYGND